ncbi:MAG: adenylate/guanylate cyclase domain-containing protein [Aquisalinus sp.]|nr:adenylate/guanylate cyclase domain-containing protein [Aquisalinus sp.]
MADNAQRIRLLVGRSKKLIPLFLGLASVVMSLFSYWYSPDALKDVGNILFDEYQRQKPREYLETPVKVIDIDDESLEVLGQWPWPRTDFADMSMKLGQIGAAAVVYDVVFSEPDRTSPGNIAGILLQNGLSFDAFDAITALPDHDEYLGQSFAQADTNIVTGYFLTQFLEEGKEQELPPVRYGFVEIGASAKDVMPTYETSTRTLPVIDEGAQGSGFVSVASIDGGVIRKAPLLARIDEQIFPSLSLEALRVAIGAGTIQIKSSSGSGQLGSGSEGPAFVSLVRIVSDIGDYQIPTTETGDFLVHYSEERSERRVSAWKVIKAGTGTPGAYSMQELQELLGGHIILIGPSAPGLLDLRSTPMNGSYPGVLIHAQMVEQMLNKQFLTNPYWGQTVVGVIIMVGGTILAFMLSFLGAVRGGLITVISLVALFYVSWWLYAERQILFDPTFAAAALVFISMVTIISSFYLTESEKAEIRGAFDHYLSPDMVDQIADDPTLLQLGGVEKDITILFCDVRSFSKISEKLTPQELITFLNNFLTPMTEILMDSKSTIDKYIGDAIMSFWNAPLDDPDHARNACRGSLLMIDTLREMNKLYDADPDNAPLPVETNIGIGLNSGPCSVGNMGSTQRFAYSVLGDAVNLSSRLEGLTKQYKLHIIIGSATAEGAPDFARVEVDQLRVVGRQAPETIYTLVGDEKEAQTATYKQWHELQMAYLNAYRSQQWDEAERIAAEARPLAATWFVDGYYDIMQTRIDEYRQNPPGEDWDGVYQATSK